MKDIAIYGAGGLGREVASDLRRMTWANPGGWNLVGFFDDGEAPGTPVGTFGTVLGGIDTLNAWPKPLGVALCFGAPKTIMTVRGRITNPLVSFPNLVSDDFSVSDPTSFAIGSGNIITGNCTVTTNVTIGNFNLLNGSVTFGHDVAVGDFNVFMPGCRISGEVHIGTANLIGAMAFVRQQLRIGTGVCLAPLSPLLTKPKDDSLYMGNPAKLIKY